MIRSQGAEWNSISDRSTHVGYYAMQLNKRRRVWREWT